MRFVDCSEKRFANESIFKALVPIATPLISLLVHYSHSGCVCFLKKDVDHFLFASVKFNLQLINLHLFCMFGVKNVRQRLPLQPSQSIFSRSMLLPVWFSCFTMDRFWLIQVVQLFGVGCNIASQSAIGTIVNPSMCISSEIADRNF